MKKNLAVLFSIIILSAAIGFSVRLVFAQLGWEEPTNTPPLDNDIPLWIKNGNNLYHTTGGNLGVGTTSPTEKLHVVGNAIVSGTLTAGTISGSYSGTINAGNVSAGSFGANTGGGNYTFPSNVYFPGSGIWNSSGNVGIGTTSPGQKLTVVGTVESTSGGFKFPDGTTQTTAAGTGVWATNGTNIYNTNTGNVGIGTTSPGALLTVKRTTGPSLSSSNNYTLEAISTWTAGRNYGIRAEATGSGATANTGGMFNAYGAAINRAIYIDGPSAGSSNYAIFSGSSAKSYFAGDVGIGTSTPAYKLDVYGDTRTTGNTTLGNAGTDTTTVNGSLTISNTNTVASSAITSAKPDNYLQIKVNGTDYAIPLYLFGQLVNNKHTVGDCTNNGGVIVTSGADKFCQFTNNTFPGFGGARSSSVSCPSGWSWYNKWSNTGGSKCTGRSVSTCSGRTSCSTSSHSWQDKAQETCSYKYESWVVTRCKTDNATCYAWVEQIGCY